MEENSLNDYSFAMSCAMMLFTQNHCFELNKTMEENSANDYSFANSSAMML
jgi:hypothetical protein